MFNKMILINVAIFTLMAVSAQAMLMEKSEVPDIAVTNKNNVAGPYVEAQGVNIWELCGNTTNYKAHSVAVVELDPKTSTKRHYHPKVAESYYVVSGKGELIFGTESEGNAKKSVLEAGDLVVIPQNTIHQVINLSDSEKLVFIAIVTPAWTLDCMAYPSDVKK